MGEDNNTDLKKRNIYNIPINQKHELINYFLIIHWQLQNLTLMGCSVGREHTQSKIALKP